jgi:hypothetical protein
MLKQEYEFSLQIIYPIYLRSKKKTTRINIRFVYHICIFISMSLFFMVLL